MGSAAVREIFARLLDAPLAITPVSRVPEYAVAGSLSYGVLNRGTVAASRSLYGFVPRAGLVGPVIVFPNVFRGGSTSTCELLAYPPEDQAPV